MSESKLNGKSFVISRRLVWEAWLRVKANKGAAGVDEQSIQAFEANLVGNLYKLWNRMCSGSYMRISCMNRGLCYRSGRGGQRPPRASIASAIAA